jgi:hypothetical protein
MYYYRLQINWVFKKKKTSLSSRLISFPNIVACRPVVRQRPRLYSGCYLAEASEQRQRKGVFCEVTADGCARSNGVGHDTAKQQLHCSRGMVFSTKIWTLEWLCWRGPAIIGNDRHVVSSERAPHINKPSTV